MGRRDFIVLWLQALFLALFPWLRSDEGLAVLGPAVDAMVPTQAIELGAFTAILKQKYSQASIYEWLYSSNPMYALVNKR